MSKYIISGFTTLLIEKNMIYSGEEKLTPIPNKRVILSNQNIHYILDYDTGYIYRFELVSSFPDPFYVVHRSITTLCTCKTLCTCIRTSTLLCRCGTIEIFFDKNTVTVKNQHRSREFKNILAARTNMVDLDMITHKDHNIKVFGKMIVVSQDEDKCRVIIPISSILLF
jgi:hypothetical protein